MSMDASACEGRLKTSAGKCKNLSTKQFWVQGAIQGYGLEVWKVPRVEDAAEVLAHPVAEREPDEGEQQMICRTPEELLDGC